MVQRTEGLLAGAPGLGTDAIEISPPTRAPEHSQRIDHGLQRVREAAGLGQTRQLGVCGVEPGRALASGHYLHQVRVLGQNPIGRQ
jgi:hypothetical protein